MFGQIDRAAGVLVHGDADTHSVEILAAKCRRSGDEFGSGDGKVELFLEIDARDELGVLVEYRLRDGRRGSKHQRRSAEDASDAEKSHTKSPVLVSWIDLDVGA